MLFRANGRVIANFLQAVSVAYFAVTAMLIPSMLLLKKLSAKVFFPLCMVTCASDSHGKLGGISQLTVL